MAVAAWDRDAVTAPLERRRGLARHRHLEDEGEPISTDAERAGCAMIAGATGTGTTEKARSAGRAAWNSSLPPCLARMMTRPGTPVRRRAFFSITAGPATTSNETGRPEVALAVSVKGASATVRVGSSANTICWGLRESAAASVRAGEGSAARTTSAANAARTSPGSLAARRHGAQSASTLTWTTVAGGNPLKWVDDAWLYAPIFSL